MERIYIMASEPLEGYSIDKIQDLAAKTVDTETLVNLYAAVSNEFGWVEDNEYDFSEGTLGWCYSKGISVAQSDLQAIKWFRRGAAQGYAAAQNHLGEMYTRCMGNYFLDDDSLEERMRKAKWRNKALLQYHQAAAQEYAPAQHNIGWELLWGNDPFHLENTDPAEWF